MPHHHPKRIPIGVARARVGDGSLQDVSQKQVVDTLRAYGDSAVSQSTLSKRPGRPDGSDAQTSYRTGNPLRRPQNSGCVRRRVGESLMSDQNPEGIKAGDVVQLKSGGPKMTVNWAEEQYGRLMANCDWFIQDKAPWKKENATFPPSSLKKVE